MIPMGRLSSVVVSAEYVSPDNVEPTSKLIDYELGGVALNDPSGGLQDRIWTCTCDGETGDVYLEAPGIASTKIFTAPNTTEISLAFDQNMRPFFAYVQDGQAKYRWYDTVLGANRISLLGPTDRSPRCCLDDKRPYQTAQGSGDIILAYRRGEGGLYYRQQRDRFEVEYELTTTAPGKNLLRVGMNAIYRLQFLLE